MGLSRGVLGCHTVGCTGVSRDFEWVRRMLGDSRVGGSCSAAVALSVVLWLLFLGENV